MNTRFHKMHGLANDFVIFDAREAPVVLTGAQVRALGDRRTGIGFDQMIMLEPSSVADVKMRIWNVDGSEVESCGNASRCVTMLLGGAPVIETAGGIIHGDASGAAVTVELIEPRFAPEEIPVLYAMDTAAMPVGWDELRDPFAVNVGNPHLVFFVPDADGIDIEATCPQIERDPLFPQGINVNVASIADGKVRLRTFERGVGPTPACGTGACATAVAAIARRLLPSPVTVSQDGGEIVIDWTPGGKVRMTGPAVHVFTGEVSL